MKKIILTLLVGTMLSNLTACGTILHPERKGQRSGRIDPGIVVLDGVGLLFFLIPGVIAYAVDFTNGTIYLPGGRHSSLEENLSTKEMTAVQVGKENLSDEKIKTVVYNLTGKIIDLNDPNIKVYKANADKERVG